MSVTALGYLLIYTAGLFSSITGKALSGVLVYLFAFYMHAPARWWGYGLPSIRWSLLAAIVTFISILLWNKDKSDWLKRTEVKLFLTYVVWVWLQNAWALNSNLQLEYSILVTKFLILMYVFSETIKNEKHLILFLLVNTLGCAYFGWIGYSEHRGGRFEDVGTPGMDDGNLLSIHMAPIFIVSCYLLFCDLGKKKYLLVPFIGLILNAIFLTQSRGGLLALVASGIVAILFVPKNIKTKFISFVFVGLFSAASIVGPQLLDRISTVTDNDSIEDADKSAYSRVVILKGQYYMVGERPLFGSGHRGTLILSPDFISSTYLTGTGDGIRARGSHNLLMSLLVDQGIIGGGIFLAMVSIIFIRFFKMRKYLINNGDDNKTILFIGLNLGLICFWIASMFANSLKLEIDIWLYTVIGIVYTWIIKDEKYKTFHKLAKRSY